jgi:zinc/manganese transport system permease protein
MLLLQYPFALSALGLCLLLTGVLSFFGYHVVRRGVIFVDLALAQVASLGACVGFLIGWGEAKPIATFLLSLGFTFMGALLFSWFRGRKALPIEALIGVTYAGAMALSLIVLEKSATGSEELKEMLVGSILTVPPRIVGLAAGIFAAVGAVLFLARRPLFAITEAPEEARKRGYKLWVWDFLFYTAFGVVVTFSVRVAGVLLVFAFLIVPSLASLLALPGSAASGAWKRVAFGWGFGTVGCLAGLEASLRLDWSAGPTIVSAFILLLAIAGVAARLRGKASGQGS